MSEYVDVDIIENGKVIGTTKVLKIDNQPDEKTKEIRTLRSLMHGTIQTCDNCGFVNCENYQRQRKKEPCENYIFYSDRIIKLQQDYEKQKEINKELVDDIAELHKRIRELETQIKQANEREAQDIRARFPC